MKIKLTHLIIASLISLSVVFSAISFAQAGSRWGGVKKYRTSSASGYSKYKRKSTRKVRRPSTRKVRKYRTTSASRVSTYKRRPTRKVRRPSTRKVRKYRTTSASRVSTYKKRPTRNVRKYRTASASGFSTYKKRPTRNVRKYRTSSASGYSRYKKTATRNVRDHRTTSASRNSTFRFPQTLVTTTGGTAKFDILDRLKKARLLEKPDPLPKKHADLSAWQNVPLDLVYTTMRRPLVGVLAMGPMRFAVAYMRPGSASSQGDSIRIGGDLLVREFNLETGFKGPAKTISTNEVGFIRASMSPALRVSDCPPIVSSPVLSVSSAAIGGNTISTRSIANNTTGGGPTLKSSKIFNTLNTVKKSGKLNSPAHLTKSSTQSSTRAPFTNGYANFFVFDEQGDFGADVGTVKLTRILSCGYHFRFKTVVVSDGRKPSLAIGKTATGDDRLLVVYGSRTTPGELRGRFFNSTGQPMGPDFLIYKYPTDDVWSTFSTDVIWNPRSERFIVGFTIHRGGVDSYTNGRIYNTSVFLDGTSTMPVQHGYSDTTRGHHTWVDIDRRQSTNPEGLYAWWYKKWETDTSAKNIYIMDRFGQPTGEGVWFHKSGEEASATDMNMTPPFAALHQPETQVLNFRSPILNFRDQYVTALSHNGHHGQFEHDKEPILIRTFSADGKLIPHGKTPKPLYGSRLRGIGTLDRHTVYVHAYPFYSTPDTLSATQAFLTVRLNRDSEVVSP